jgi:hypothetical protein
MSDTTEPQDEPLEKQFIREGWTSDGEHEHPVALPPKEPLDLPPGVDSSSDLGDADVSVADLTGANLTDATMPDGSIHD